MLQRSAALPQLSQRSLLALWLYYACHHLSTSTIADREDMLLTGSVQATKRWCTDNICLSNDVICSIEEQHLPALSHEINSSACYLLLVRPH
jgi:hypothetical protein